MSRKYILTSTLTWHFIYFAKLMGFYPKICLAFREFCNSIGYCTYQDGIPLSFYQKGSFNEYISGKIFGWQFLCENVIKHVYFMIDYKTTEAFFEEKEIDELTSLFFSYLKDKKIYRYIKIYRDY